MTNNKESYQDLKSQLDDVLIRLQDENLDIDEAVKLHEQGQKLIAKLEKYLEESSAVVAKIVKK